MSKPFHYIGCGCVVTDREGRYLLVRETKAVARGRLAMPAGSLEPDETLREAAVREVQEETGFDVEIIGLLGIFHCPRTSENSFGINFVFDARIVGGTLTASEEHPEFAWLTPDEIDALEAEGAVRGTHVALAVRRSEAGVHIVDDVTLVPAVPSAALQAAEATGD